MSQTKINTSEFEVVSGYDRPFNHYFANIYYLDRDDEGDDYIRYSTLDDPEADFGGGFASIEDVRKKVEAVAGKLPDEYWESAAIKDMNHFRVF